MLVDCYPPEQHKQTMDGSRSVYMWNLMNGQGLIGEQWLRTVVPSFYYWTSKHWMLEDETWRTHERVMDSVLKNDVIECTRTAASVQETLLRSCVLFCQRQRAPQPLRWLQWSGGCRTAFVCLLSVITHSRLWIIMR